MGKLLTTKEAAEKLGVTYVRVNQLIKGGELPAEKYGRDYMIDEDHLEAIRNKPETRGRPKKVDKSNA
jgi:excisionase family DNA binding protein